MLQEKLVWDVLYLNCSFSRFSVFTFSQFGGTQALGLLVSITLLVAMLTNLMVLPSIIFRLINLTTRSFKEPYFDAYDEDSETEWEELSIEKIDSSSNEE